VVRGAKINISGAYASHELVVLPQAAHPLRVKKIMLQRVIDYKHVKDLVKQTLTCNNGEVAEMQS